MFSIAQLYNSTCSYAAKPIRIQPIFMHIIFHHYKRLRKIKEELGKRRNETNDFQSDSILYLK
jgi:hypothetical protein